MSGILGGPEKGLGVGTEMVTVLFTDLVESTALMGRVGPEQAEVLRVEHFGLFACCGGGARGPGGQEPG